VTARERILDPENLGDHIDRLFRAAWALSGSRADAEDLVQETFARVLAKPRRIRSDASARRGRLHPGPDRICRTCSH
jgi:DNA-directed RNA polymerase specialized sigma24 family protein